MNRGAEDQVAAGDGQRELDRDRRLASLLEAAMVLSETDREAMLSARCEDPGLIAEVLSILAREESEEESVLPPLPSARRLAEALGFGAEKPVKVGPYRIEEVIGEGGMGVVYAASQTEPVQRQVAIKLIRSALAGPRERARFEVEQRALARLSHPHIAQLLEVGTTGDGQPYFVMELVAGEPITDYCNARSLPITDRLRIFVEVCRALEHAHRNQLLHRDIKPSNVIVAEVEGHPVPKVIDFGIAKVLDASETARLATVQGILGTPTYMSPEALAGEDLDTRTDVYSLGILLYGLVCGGQPYGEKELSLPELIRRIHSHDAVRPSRRLAAMSEGDALEVSHQRGTSPGELGQALRTDLDWVVLKALEKNRERRYSSAAELAADVESFLDTQPVAARPPSRAYRLRKWSRRNRGAVMAGALALLALVSTLVLGIRYTLDLQRERSATELARNQAEHLVTFLLEDLYQELEPLGRRDFLERVVGEANRYFEGLPEELAQQTLTHRAEALRYLGSLKVARGDLTSAREAYEEALELDRRALEQGAGSEAKRGLALDYRRLSRVLTREGDGSGALELSRRSWEIHSELAESEPESPVWRTELAYGSSELGWSYRGVGDREREIAFFQASVDAYRGLLDGTTGSEVERAHQQLYLGWVLKDLATSLVLAGRADKAEVVARESVQILEAELASDPTNLTSLYNAGSAWISLALVLRSKGEVEQALQASEEALAVLEDWVVADPSAGEARVDLALVHVVRGMLLQESGQLPEGSSELEAALANTRGSVTSSLDGQGVEALALVGLGRRQEALALAAPLATVGYTLDPFVLYALEEAELVRMPEKGESGPTPWRFIPGASKK